MSQAYDIITEPAGATYRQLVAFAEAFSGSFSLVWRQQLSFDASAAVLKDALRPFLIHQTRSSAWPGTTLIGHSAMVRTYRWSPDSARTLAAADRLFAWHAPARPEDLAFYAPDGRCWLGSIAHERQAFVTLEANDLAKLRLAVPALELRRSGKVAG